MNFCCYSATASAQLSWLSIRAHTGSASLGFYESGINHGDASFGQSDSQHGKDIGNDASFAPASEFGMNRRPFSIKFRYMAPCQSILDHKNNGAKDHSVIQTSDIFSHWQILANPVKLPLRYKGCFHIFKPHGEV